MHFGLKLYKDDEIYGVDVDDTRHMWNILVFKSPVCIPNMGCKDAGVYVAPFLNLQEGISLGDHFKGFLLSIPFSSWRVFDIYNLERQFMSSRFGPFVDLGERYVDGFLQLVEKNCLKERKLDFYARQLGISSAYLSATVSKFTGKKASQWISESVIEIANNQLCSTSSPISEIAEKVGFASCSDFCRFYKSNTGVSPRKYRRNVLMQSK